MYAELFSIHANFRKIFKTGTELSCDEVVSIRDSLIREGNKPRHLWVNNHMANYTRQDGLTCSLVSSKSSTSYQGYWCANICYNYVSNWANSS